jgi:hypothetical protein
MLLLNLLILIVPSLTFNLHPTSQKTRLISPLSSLPSSTSSSSQSSSSSSLRRAFLKSALSLPLLPLLPSPSYAFGKLSTLNSKLSSYGLPPLSPPKGFSPLLQPYGLGSNRTPVLIAFNHPGDWVVTLPSNDVNGEDGTVQAGNYAKGDTATFYVAEGEKGDVGDKDVAERCLRKAISQKGDNVYQNFKVLGVKEEDREGKKYAVVDFKYELLTGAGFEVDRRGVAAITNVGGNAGVLWTATLTPRYKKMGEDMKSIVESFRAYSEGIQFERITYDEYGRV